MDHFLGAAEAERLAEDNGLQSLFLRRSNVRKEALVEKLLAERGKEPGLVCILSALETCQSYKLADSLDVRELHSQLDRYALKCCPVLKQLGVSYYWSIMQLEYATDIVYRDRRALAPLYEAISRTAIHAVKPEHVATFLGRRLTCNFSAELGNDFNTRIQGTRTRHRMGPTPVRMYDKFGRVLRIETTTNDVSFFKHHRNVE